LGRYDPSTVATKSRPSIVSHRGQAERRPPFRIRSESWRIVSTACNLTLVESQII